MHSTHPYRRSLRAVVFALSTAAAPLCGALATAAEPAPPAPATPTAPGVLPARPAIGEFGLDLAGLDPALKPGDDFFRYAAARWLASEQLPADRARWGSFDRLGAKSEADVHGLLEEAAAGTAPAGSIARKVGDYYAAFLDTAAIEAAGLAPAQPGLAAIAAARTHEDVARLLARADLGLPSPIDFDVTIDQKNPDRYLIEISHGGLGLPEREYYLRDDEQFAGIRAAYRAHVERLLALAGDRDAADAARGILALETQIAKLHWPIAKRRERDLMYNLYRRDELVKLAPDYPWNDALATAGAGQAREFVVRELDAIPSLATLFRATPVAGWRSWLRYHYLRRNAPVLPKAFDDEVFAFFGHTLNGQPEQRARWKRAVQATNAGIGEGVGQVYVQRFLPPAAKAQMLALVENLRRAYAERIRALTWMSEYTKQVAYEKLRTFRPKIGYPDRWRDYSALVVTRGDAFGNAQRAQAFEWNRRVARLDKPTDRDEWLLNPQTVNAYYNPVFNEIVFPAAILQPPFFDPAADPAVNYGAIGGVIGHEMGHGFDDQGAKSDARGVLRTWWNARDTQAFEALTSKLAEQYSAYEPLPGIAINGRLTLGENIGDLGGLQVALTAYRLSLGDKPAPTLAGLSGEQRFFLGWAQVWRVLYRDQSLRNQIMSDPHSPGMYRVNGVVRNIDAWYEAFGVKPGDALYLPPEQRIRIW